MKLHFSAKRKFIILPLVLWPVLSFAQELGSAVVQPMSPCNEQHPASAEPCATPPHMINASAPIYPEDERRSGVQGTVVLSFVVGTDGLVQDIQIVESIGKAFDDAAVETVKKWRFTPGTYAGRSVPVHTRATLNFRLVGASQPAVATASVSEAHDGQFQKLEAIKVEKPVYPLKARQEGIQGEVWLKRLVATSGDVEHVEVISGDPLLAKAATKAAKRWKFKPFIRDGRAVEVATKLPFDFAFQRQDFRYRNTDGRNSRFRKHWNTTTSALGAGSQSRAAPSPSATRLSGIGKAESHPRSRSHACSHRQGRTYSRIGTALGTKGVNRCGGRCRRTMAVQALHAEQQPCRS